MNGLGSATSNDLHTHGSTVCGWNSSCASIHAPEWTVILIVRDFDISVVCSTEWASLAF